jgi:hypothetical protein
LIAIERSLRDITMNTAHMIADVNCSIVQI